MVYKVKLQAFEGPFDLLVYLIEQNRMSIYDIKVAEITSQYIEYIREAQEHNIEIAQDFMVMAAELIEIKSRMLLPQVTQQPGEEEPEDPRSQLVARILEYKQFKEMASFLAEQEEINSHIYGKPSEDLSQYTGEPEEYLKGDMESFAKAFIAFIHKKQRLDEMHRTYERVERARMSMENRIMQMTEYFKVRKTMMFSEMIKDDDSPFNRVITFTALLELLKQHSVTAEQKKRYGDITIKRVEEGAND